MDFTTAVKTCFQKFATFEGRATRSEYWWFWLFNFILGIVLVFIPFVNIIAGLAMIIPNLAVAARRLHDTGRSGLLLLLYLIPFIGALVIFIFCLLESGEDNQYGPKQVA